MKKSVFIFLCMFPVLSYAALQATSFPKTYSDVSFSDRMKNEQTGYIPYMNKRAYEELGIEPGEEQFIDQSIQSVLDEQEEEAQREQDAHNMNIDEYCQAHPNDEDLCSDDSFAVTEPVVTTPVVTQPAAKKCAVNWTIGGSPVVENNSVTGGSCYPANKVFKPNKLSNKILTTGRYEKKAPAFEKGMMTVFRKEGHCGKLKGDPGKYTCFGITETSSKMTPAQLSKLTRADAEDWYYQHFWIKYKIGTLPDVISTDYFLASMGTGPVTICEKFSKFLKVKINKKGCEINNNMINAVKNYSGDIHKDWMDVRAHFLEIVADNYLKNHGLDIRAGYRNSIDMKRRNGCHVCPDHPIKR